MSENNQWLTKQEIFDKVAVHLLMQNQKSVDVIGRCAYRGVQGKMCAAGVLIKDEFYSPALECKSVKQEPVSYALRESGVDMSSYSYLVLDLQKLHDDYLTSDWKMFLDRVAFKYSLDTSCLNAF